MPETFTYFGYGSNMLTKRLRARTPSATPIGTGYVAGHRLTFDKVSADKLGNSSGKCDMEGSTSPTDRVYGVLFSILESERPELDKAEGLGKGYERKTITVIRDGMDCSAEVYVATKKDASLIPYHWYKALVVAGAVEHRLPPSYVEWIRTVSSQPDPDAKRRADEEALLFGHPEA